MLQYNWNLYNWNFVTLRGSTERAKKNPFKRTLLPGDDVGVRYRYLIGKLFKFDRCQGQSDTNVIALQLSMGIAPNTSFLVCHSIISSHATFFLHVLLLFSLGGGGGVFVYKNTTTKCH